MTTINEHFPLWKTAHIVCPQLLPQIKIIPANVSHDNRGLVTFSFFDATIFMGSVPPEDRDKAWSLIRVAADRFMERINLHFDEFDGHACCAAADKLIEIKINGAIREFEQSTGILPDDLLQDILWGEFGISDLRTVPVCDIVLKNDNWG